MTGHVRWPSDAPPLPPPLHNRRSRHTRHANKRRRRNAAWRYALRYRADGVGLSEHWWTTRTGELASARAHQRSYRRGRRALAQLVRDALQRNEPF